MGYGFVGCHFPVSNSHTPNSQLEAEQHRIIRDYANIETIDRFSGQVFTRLLQKNTRVTHV